VSIVNPENDAPVDHMKIHKDVINVMRLLWSGAGVIVLAAAWVTTLAQDVSTNAEKIEDAATKEQLNTTVEILTRLESKIDKQDERQREIQKDISSLQTDVENLKDSG
jgi:septal ring factor EnvC (AmiA/AmiB activator)